MFDNFNLKIKILKSLWRSFHGTQTKRLIKIQNLRNLVDKYEKILLKNK